MCRRLRRTAVAILVAWVPVAAADDGRVGWHGEVMPDGLARGEAEGEYVWQRDGSVMVFVPEGAFPMGSADGPAPERPVHEVHLSAYYIDKYEVTWRQWKLSGLRYNEELHSRYPGASMPDWGILDDHPVGNVTWDYANRYADWAGKRLPTEAEWEKAARGTDGRRFPWGNDEPTHERAVWKEHPISKDSTGPAECCAEGASPYGVHNMAGNVYEWCQDVYSATFYAESPREDPLYDGEGRHRVLRGGAFLYGVDPMVSSRRYRLLPGDRTSYIGFRLVLPLATAPEELAAAQTQPAS